MSEFKATYNLSLQAGTKTPAAAIASGMPLIVTAADRRARAVYYSFTLLCIGLLVLLVVVLVESHKWRTTVSSESQVNTCRASNAT